MSRVPVSSASASPSTSFPAAEALTVRQAQIVRLTFVEGMKQFRIAQVLRISASTVRRDLAAALITLRKSEEDLSADVLQKEGRIRLDITIAYASDQVVTRADTTMLLASTIMSIPGFREAYEAPDSSPDRIKAIHAVQGGQGAKKRKRRLD